jgi:hypothetical protein
MNRAGTFYTGLLHDGMSTAALPKTHDCMLVRSERVQDV